MKTVFQLNSFFHLSLRGIPAEFLNENKSIQKTVESICIDSVFYDDFKYTIGLDQKRIISVKSTRKLV
jgi:hypothetical protein